MNLRLDADGKTRVVAERAKLDSDQAATLFRNTVLPHLADGLALARWLAGDATDAEDIVQEAAMKALRGIDTFEGSNARAWLLAIVRNTTFSWLAKHRPKALVMVGGLAEIDETTYSADAGSGPIPDTPEAALKEAAAVPLALVFSHPFDNGFTMEMGKPEAFYVIAQRGDGPGILLQCDGGVGAACGVEPGKLCQRYRLVLCRSGSGDSGGAFCCGLSGWLLCRFGGLRFGRLCDNRCGRHQ